VVWDSVAQSSTLDEVKGEITDHNVGNKARLLSKGLRKIVPFIARKTALVFINQVRDKIGAMSWGGGKPTDTVGGWAIKFNASLRIELKKVGKIQKDEKSIGIKCSAYTVKNKTYAPFKRAEYDMFFQGGIEDSDYLLNALVKEEQIDQSGGWYSHKTSKKKFQRKDFKAFLLDMQKSSPEQYQEFMKLALKIYE
jgi:recombination protein RecA